MFPVRLLKKVAERQSYVELRDRVNGKKGPCEPAPPDKKKEAAKLIKSAFK